MRYPKIIIPSSSILSIPPHIAKCPYCDGALFARFSAFTEVRRGVWKCDGVELECESEPELDDNADAWDDHIGSHTYMPYVYWLPVCDTVEKWVNRYYRFQD